MMQSLAILLIIGSAVVLGACDEQKQVAPPKATSADTIKLIVSLAPGTTFEMGPFLIWKGSFDEHCAWSGEWLKNNFRLDHVPEYRCERIAP